MMLDIKKEIYGDIEADEYQTNKIQWLESTDFTEKTKISYWSTLNTKIHPLELAYHKDLYDFSSIEIEGIIESVSSISSSTAMSVHSIIFAYINWCIKIGMCYTGNPCSSIKLKDIVKINTKALKESYMDYQSFYDYIYSLEGSNVDKCMIMLLRSGVQLNDLEYLTWNDINKDENTIRITREGKTFTIPVINNLLYDSLDLCKKCEEYNYLSETKNGGTKENRTNYINGKFIIKQTEKSFSRSSSEAVNVRSLHTRIRIFFSNNNLPKIKMDSLKKAAIYDVLYSIYSRNGRLTYNDSKNAVKLLEPLIDEKYVDIKAFKIRETFSLLSDIPFYKK